MSGFHLPLKSFTQGAARHILLSQFPGISLILCFRTCRVGDPFLIRGLYGILQSGSFQDGQVSHPRTTIGTGELLCLGLRQPRGMCEFSRDREPGASVPVGVPALLIRGIPHEKPNLRCELFPHISSDLFTYEVPNKRCLYHHYMIVAMIPLPARTTCRNWISKCITDTKTPRSLKPTWILESWTERKSGLCGHHWVPVPGACPSRK